jgi:hypothetical protein
MQNEGESLRLLCLLRGTDVEAHTIADDGKAHCCSD